MAKLIFSYENINVDPFTMFEPLLTIPCDFPWALQGIYSVTISKNILKYNNDSFLKDILI